MDGDGDGCIRDYDLATYTGETMGLCPAAEVNHCDCGDVGAADLLVCAPDGSACTVQHGVCAGGNVPDCGWHECAWPSEQPQTDELCQDLVASIEAAAADTEHDRRCVRDDDCTLPGRCVRRVHNLMFCADPPE